jgi:glyoxylase-like metal-dependent hydrolase (beta-lactamase superfamily II)
MKLYVLDNGFAPDMPREARVRTGAPFDPGDQVAIPVMSFLIETEKGLTLYDTGWSSGERHPRPWRIPEKNTVTACLDRLGYKPGDIHYVIMSHLHYDHAGYLEHFAGAEVYVSEPELNAVRELYAKGELGGFYIREDYEAWERAPIKWRAVKVSDKPVPFARGVDLLSFGAGHAHGLLCLLLKLPRYGTIVIASDAIYCKDNIGPPRRPPGVMLDEAGYNRTVDSILEYCRQHNAELWYGHDMDQFRTWKKSDEGWYE